VLGAIVALGVSKELIDLARFGAHHTSVSAKVSVTAYWCVAPCPEPDLALGLG
jgi:hypothetical protein